MDSPKAGGTAASFDESRNWGEESKGEATPSKTLDESTTLMNTSTIMPDDDDFEILSQDIRIKKFGVGAYGPNPSGDGILFKAGTWKPGGEYIQKLIVRNVSTTVKKIKYKLPTTRFFSLAYPEVITLSPGVSTELDVIFRPVEANPYDDTIFIRVVNGTGGFHVSVRATIDKLIVKAPYGLDLGFCPTYQTTEEAFELTNSGEVDAPYRWEIPTGFAIEPSEGVIPAGEKALISVSVVPQEAVVMVSKAVCHIGEGVHAIIPEPVINTRLSAIGKYAYISVSDPALKWGEVLTGSSPASLRKEFVLRNTSVVPAEFSVIRHESDSDEVFDVQPREGVVQPQSEILVTATYSALGVGVYSMDRYTFITPGDCRSQIELSGTSVAAKVICFKDASASADNKVAPDGSIVFAEGAPGNSLNFRDVEIGHTETRILMMRNLSEKDVHFSICAGLDGTFKMSPRQGVIKAQGPPFPVVMSFSPHHPINYYRRIWVTVSDRMPLFYDAMGSGYIRAKGEVKEQRPFPLRHAHVQAYRNRVVADLGALNPDELDRAYEEGKIDPAMFAHVGKDGTRALSMTALMNPLSRTGDCTRVDVAPAHEMFISDTDLSIKDVSADRTQLDFGYTTTHKTSESKTVTLSNNTNGKVTVQWHVPRAVTEDGDFQEEVFFVTPMNVDINAGQTHTFKIIFRPFQADRNFTSELEAFVYFKNQRTFRLVNDATMTPPWCIPITSLGHTFSSGQLLASARFSGSNVRDSKMVFPCCFEGETLYQPLLVKNPTNLPSTFRFEMGFGENRLGGISSDDVFSVWPPVGEINAEGFVVVYVRFIPTAAKKYIQLMKCIVNGTPSTKLLLEGSCTTPFLLCPDITPSEPLGAPKMVVTSGGVELGVPGVTSPPQNIETGPVGSFFLKPTCVGLSTSRAFSLKNGSRLPLRYRLSLPPEAEGIATVTPTSGLLRGNEIAMITVAFVPKEAEKYTFKLKAKCYAIGGIPERVSDARQPMGTNAPELLQSINLLVVAPGEIGAVQFDPPRLSMDVRLVNTDETSDLYLENVSDCDLKYKLGYREEFLKDEGGILTAEKAKEETIVSPLRDLPITDRETGSKKTKESEKDKTPEDLKDSISCTEPTGTIMARSKKRLPITFLPKKAGLFDFFLYCQVKIIDPREPGEAMMLPNEEMSLLRVNQKDRETCMAGQGLSALANLPLTTCITARATFPKVTIEDVRVEEESIVNDVTHLWRNFALEELNTDLSKPLTDSEARLNLSSSPDLSQIKRYKFEFTPDVVGSPLQVMTFKFKNNGHLTTKFHLHLPNEKELELEQWCDEDEPSEELYKIICMIEELKLFKIEPNEGLLEPGESCDLTISYSHSHLKYGGVHNLPVHVKLDKGKQFFLDLCGRTLPSTTNAGAKPPMLTNAPESASGLRGPPKPLPLTNINSPPPVRVLLTASLGQSLTYRLSDVPIGLREFEAPMQRMEIVNVSAFRASYEVDVRALDGLMEQNHGMPILRLANPMGYVESRESAFLEWYFYPLENKTYSLPIKIKYEEAPAIDVMLSSPAKGNYSSEMPPRAPNTANTKRRSLDKLNSADDLSEIRFTLTASGFDPRERYLNGDFIDKRDLMMSHVYGLTPPSEQLITFKKQLAHISHDIFDLKFVPQNSKNNRMLMIKNLNAHDSVEFTIDSATCQLVADGLLSIYPLSGVLEPLEHTTVDFSFDLQTKAMCIIDRVKITVREIVKAAPRRRGVVPSKIIDRLLKKPDPKEHESVVRRITKSRDVAIEHFQAMGGAEGKTSSMPCTVNEKGEVLAGVKYGTAPMAPDDNVAAGPNLGFEGSFAPSHSQAGSTFTLPPDGVVGVGEDALKSQSQVGGKTGGSERGGGSRGSRGTMLGSASMKRQKASNDHSQQLRGKSNCFILRLRGTVLPSETLCGLFKERRPKSDKDNKDSTFMHDFFVPPRAPFIEPINSATFLRGHAEEEAGKTKQKVRVTNIFGVMDDDTQFEVRSVSELVINDIFKTLLDGEDVSEYLRDVSKEANSCSVAVSKEKGAGGATILVDGPLCRDVKLEGNPVYGVYFDEVGIKGEEKAAATVTRERAISKGDEAGEDQFDEEIPFPPEMTEAGKEKQEQAAVALSDSTFLDLAGEILRNTMYNLMQEAACDEFSVDAEPLAFIVKE